jgi:catechol 2,3-dioxygenase-like lactoylglutathione lyase family enzyme
MKNYGRLLFFICLNLSVAIFTCAQVKKVGAIGITVKDMDRSVIFYSKVLGFKKVGDAELYGPSVEQLQGIFGIRIRVVKMQLGDEFIELTDYLTSGGRSIPQDARSNDLSFQHIAIVVSNMDKAYLQLRKFNIEHVSTSPQTIPLSNSAAAGVKAFYFHDPDGHNLELIYFPPGKGQSKWRNSGNKLFLGIDHTAIGISNTDSSLHFYQDLLGMMRKGDSWNKGIEQAHLNFVENASLHITGLRAAEGPGIEFLEYLVPGPGKKYPDDSRADDLWHWQTTLVVNNVTDLFNKLAGKAYKLVSGGLVELIDKEGKKIKAFIIRDGDGHAMMFRENIE